VTHEPNLRFYAGVPLVTPAGQKLGTICVIDTVPRELSSVQIEALYALGRQVVAQLELRRKLLESNHLTRELQHSAVALQNSEGQFSKVFHSNPIACSISTLKEGRFLDVNTSFLRMFGYSREEVIGRTSAELKIWADQIDRNRLIQLLQQQSAQQQPVQQDAPFRTSSGEVRQGMASFERIEIQEEVCLLSMVYDITDRKQAETEQLQQMQFGSATSRRWRSVDRRRILAGYAATLRDRSASTLGCRLCPDLATRRI
jgi:PAS domain S-box-containing protein